MVVVD
jgi:hypothetical protein